MDGWMDGWVGELVVGLSSLPTPSVVVFGKLMQVDGFGWGGEYLLGGLESEHVVAYHNVESV